MSPVNRKPMKECRRYTPQWAPSVHSTTPHSILSLKNWTVRITESGCKKSSFEDFICKLDMINIYYPTWGGVWKSGIIWMVICRILKERLRPQLWVICVIFIFFHICIFSIVLLFVYMLNRDPIMYTTTILNENILSFYSFHFKFHKEFF